MIIDDRAPPRRTANATTTTATSSGPTTDKPVASASDEKTKAAEAKAQQAALIATLQTQLWQEAMKKLQEAKDNLAALQKGPQNGGMRLEVEDAQKAVSTAQSHATEVGTTALDAQRAANTADAQLGVAKGEYRKVPYPEAQITQDLTANREDLASYVSGKGQQGTEAAVKAIDGILLGAPQFTATDHNSMVLFDPRNVNASEASVAAQAKDVLMANEGREEDAIKTLSPQQQMDYSSVRKSLGEDYTAQLSLQRLLFTGKLTAPVSKGGDQKPLVDQLATATLQQPTKGIPQDQLIRDLIKEVAVPSAINQGDDKGTCAPTAAVSMQLAQTNPAEYARLALGLASPGGSVTLQDGKTALTRQPGDLPPADGRTVVQRLMAPALMELGDGPQMHYSDSNDSERYVNDPVQRSSLTTGLSGAETQQLMSSVVGVDSKIVGRLDSPYPTAAAGPLLDAVAKEANQGKLVPVGMNIGLNPNELGHQVLVSHVDKDYVEFWNPWGQVERMSTSEFLKRANSALVSPNAPAAEPTRSANLTGVYAA